jgi:ABC-type transport system involved in cytochrome c biogenesis permease subunit
MVAAYLMLRANLDTTPQRAVLGAVLGAIMLPSIVVNHFAVLWWRGQHPMPVVARPGGLAIDDRRMIVALVFSLLTFTLLFLYFMLERIRLERARQALAERQAVAPEPIGTQAQAEATG